MKNSLLKNFRSIDSEAFAAVIRALGYAAGAVYIQDHESLIQILASDEESGWRATVPLPQYYTSSPGQDSPLGFVKVGVSPEERNYWPKSAFLYFPEQEFCETRLLFSVTGTPGKRIRAQEIHAGLESFAVRIRGLIDLGKTRRLANEEGFREHVRTFGVDLRSVIDHELRTPLSTITGYISLIESTDPKEQASSFAEFQSAIFEQSRMALTALEKLSITLHEGIEGVAAPDVENICARDNIEQVCADMNREKSEYVSGSLANKIKVQTHVTLDENPDICVDLSLFRRAMWEVLKNAVIHSRNGVVEVSVYRTDRMLVVDVIDDGEGLSPGSEDLVFLRFYQDPSGRTARKGKKGLGLGLFLARHIAERHMGKLLFIRKPGRGGLFRFLWPLSASENVSVKKEA